MMKKNVGDLVCLTNKRHEVVGQIKELRSELMELRRINAQRIISGCPSSMGNMRTIAELEHKMNNLLSVKEYLDDEISIINDGFKLKPNDPKEDFENFLIVGIKLC